MEIEESICRAVRVVMVVGMLYAPFTFYYWVVYSYKYMKHLINNSFTFEDSPAGIVFFCKHREIFFFFIVGPIDK